MTALAAAALEGTPGAVAMDAADAMESHVLGHPREAGGSRRWLESAATTGAPAADRLLAAGAAVAAEFRGRVRSKNGPAPA